MIELKAFTPQGSVLVPPSKSIAQRLIIMAAFAARDSLIQNAGTSDDVLSAAKAIECVGATVTEEKDLNVSDGSASLRIRPALPGTINVNTAIDCGESATLARMLAPLLPASAGKIGVYRKFIITGKKSILTRPMTATARFFSSLGLSCELREGFLPMEISGFLRAGIHRTISPDSSQPISGALLALTLVHSESLLLVREPESLKYITLTADLANRCGAHIEYETSKGLSIWHVRGDGVFSLPDITVENDWSSAALLMAAGALGGSIRITNMNPHTLQADVKILEILEAHGALTTVQINDRGSADYIVSEKSHRPFTADLSGTPDIFPAAALLAAASEGKSTLYGATRLAGKESKRGEELCRMLSCLGATCMLDDDALIIEGKPWFSGCSIAVPTDHRIVMAAMLASARLRGGSSIFLKLDGNATIEEVTSKSYPGFVKDFSALGGQLHEQLW